MQCQISPGSFANLTLLLQKQLYTATNTASRLIAKSKFRLEVSTAGADTLNPNTAATAYDGTTAMLTMATAGAATANIGDHVELRLKDVAPNNALTSYA